MATVALKTHIGDVLQSKLLKKEGWNLNVLSLPQGDAELVNVLGLVVNKEADSIAIDDSTGVVGVKSFSGLPLVEVGHVVQVIGRVSMREDEKIIVAQTVKAVAQEWLAVRHKELPAFQKRTFDASPQPVAEAVVEETLYTRQDEIIETIKKLDSGEGVDVGELLRNAQVPQNALDNLLKEGEIFEIKPGRVKVLE